MKAPLTSLVYFSLSLAVLAQTPALIPLPKTMTVNSGTFTLCPTQPNPPVHSTATVTI